MIETLLIWIGTLALTGVGFMLALGLIAAGWIIVMGVKHPDFIRLQHRMLEARGAYRDR
ncbi:MAG: hypothetical protein Q7T60_17185 [Sphingopyxis sp.]|nr:hypothetical protein [Sphingopyxis sp.]